MMTATPDDRDQADTGNAAEPVLHVMQRRQPVTSATLAFDGAYDGWWAKVRTNPKRKVLRLLGSGEEDKVDAALAEVVLDHNFVDEDGAPLANPLTAAAMDELGGDLYIQLVEGIGEAINKAGWVPKSP